MFCASQAWVLILPFPDNSCEFIFTTKLRVTYKMSRRSNLSCASEKKGWSNIESINKRDIDLHPERWGDTQQTFSMAASEFSSCCSQRSWSGPSDLHGLRKEPQKMNQSIWSVAAQSPPPFLQAGRGNRGSLDKFQGSLLQALFVYGLACSPQRPTQSTWRKFFRMKSHKSVFSLKPSGCNVLERYTSKDRDCSSPARCLLT